eukprot:TRINITY_DN11301_c0_g1_i1.p1 TRINITY_DN11301_c0_g1~~TRINITY_DN11301_c0_g1_i1.p1  ORF type:complete len:148 (-),score=14.99 TRINITY_DN11301_c0_g1_i1:387-830(-)
MSQVKYCGINIKETSNWQELFTGIEVKNELNPQLEEILTVIPDAKTQDNFITLYNSKLEAISKLPENGWVLAHLLYRLSRSSPETCVDDLLHPLLSLGGFYQYPFFVRHQTKVKINSGYLHLVSQPDYMVLRSKILPDIAALAIEVS